LSTFLLIGLDSDDEVRKGSEKLQGLIGQYFEGPPSLAEQAEEPGEPSQRPWKSTTLPSPTPHQSVIPFKQMCICVFLSILKFIELNFCLFVVIIFF
jgi:hypothetical protein